MLKKNRHTDNITIIEPEDLSNSFGFADLFKYKDLIILFFKRNLKVQYRQTVFGPLWVVINPLISSVVFTFVFGRFAGLSTGGLPGIVFYLLGTSMWSLCSTSLKENASTFIINQTTFGKVYYPRMSVPFSHLLTKLFNFFIQLVLVIAFMIYYAVIGEVSFSPLALLTPILALQCAVMSSAIGLIIASISVKFRDLIVMVPFFLQIWMYATPVIYPLKETGGLMYIALLINPMTPVVENFRYFFTGVGTMQTYSWAWSLLFTAAVTVIALKMFNKAGRTFIDTI